MTYSVNFFFIVSIFMAGYISGAMVGMLLDFLVKRK